MNNRLRGYQRAAVRAVFGALTAGALWVLVVMATGTGKTFTAVAIYEKWRRQNLRKHARALFVVHLNDAVRQAREEFRKHIPASVITGILAGEDEENITDCDILFATFQSIVNRLDFFTPDWFDFMIVDEAHHGHAATYKKVIEHFSGAKRLGLTATPQRMDGQDIRELFGEPVFTYDLADAINNGDLAGVDYHVLNTTIDPAALQGLIDRVRKKDPTVTRGDINMRVFIREELDVIAKRIRSFDPLDQKKKIIFCRSVAHIREVHKRFPQAKPYHSKMPKKVQRKTLEAYRNNEIRTILVRDKFNEAIDIPDADLIVFLRLTDSPTIWLQQMGRGLRLHATKDRVTILDFVANCERIRWVQEFKRQLKKKRKKRYERTKYDVQTNWTVDFDERVEDVLDLYDALEKITRDFYDTWQKASVAAQALKIKIQHQYQKVYRKDARLPSNPQTFYPDFPGWKVFLGTEKYETWQEAAKAAQALGLRSQRRYHRGYKKDKRLPSEPKRSYPDFPGWKVFLGTEKYETWQEAAKAAQALGLTTDRQYKRGYKQDPRLPSNPQVTYSDFPGWKVFLGTEKYETWQEAAKAIKPFRYRTKREYMANYKEDPRLPSNPPRSYPDFPGWKKFLGKATR